MARTSPNGDMAQCIEHCLACYRSCLETATRHCLEVGGEHVDPSHYRLMLNCAEICRTAAEFMMSKSAFHAKLCAICADICEACAESCRNIGEMDECARACEQCAASCGAMASQPRGPVQLEPLLTHPKAHLT